MNNIKTIIQRNRSKQTKITNMKILQSTILLPAIALGVCTGSALAGDVMSTPTLPPDRKSVV